MELLTANKVLMKWKNVDVLMLRREGAEADAVMAAVSCIINTSLGEDGAVVRRHANHDARAIAIGLSGGDCYKECRKFTQENDNQ